MDIGVSVDEYYELYDAYTRGKGHIAYEKCLKHLAEVTDAKKFFHSHSRRLKLHAKIIQKSLDASYRPIDSQPFPTLHLILGSIGAGKTSLYDEIDDDSVGKPVKINFDSIKRDLPEYEILKKIHITQASAFTQAEAATVGGELFRKAVDKNLVIAYEKNVSPHTIDEVCNALGKGYRVVVHIIFLDSVATAISRVEARFKKNKRYVSREVIKDSFEKLAGGLNNFLTSSKIYSAIKDSPSPAADPIFLFEFVYNGGDKMQKISRFGYTPEASKNDSALGLFCNLPDMTHEKILLAQEAMRQSLPSDKLDTVWAEILQRLEPGYDFRPSVLFPDYSVYGYYPQKLYRGLPAEVKMWLKKLYFFKQHKG